MRFDKILFRALYRPRNSSRHVAALGCFGRFGLAILRALRPMNEHTALLGNLSFAHAGSRCAPLGPSRTCRSKQPWCHVGSVGWRPATTVNAARPRIIVLALRAFQQRRWFEFIVVASLSSRLPVQMY